MYINQQNDRFQEIYSFLPDILKNNNDFFELNFPDNTGIVVLLSGKTNTTFFNAVVELMAIEQAEKMFIYPLGMDFGIRNAETCFVVLNNKVSFDDYCSVFRNEYVRSAENFVFTTENPNWFICIDFASDLSYVVFDKTSIVSQHINKIFEPISIKNYDEVIDYIVYAFPHHVDIVHLFKKNILSHLHTD